MPKNRLFTPTIIGSIKWFENCPNSWREKAQEDLTNTLSRIWKKPSPEIQRGIDMENKVYEIARSGKKVKCSKEFQMLLDECDGEMQKKGKTFYRHNGNEYCIFGKYDIWKPEVIKDIKTTKNYKRSKYEESAQHHLYCFIEQIPHFKYIVAVMSEDPENLKIQYVEKIDIELDLQSLKDIVIGYIEYVEEFFKKYPSFEKLYLEKYCLY